MYFVVISSSFSDIEVERARGIVKRTKAKPVTLLEAADLRALVELKLRTSLFDDLERLHDVFVQTRVVTAATLHAIR